VEVYSSVFFLVLAILVGLIVGRMESRSLGVTGRSFWIFAISVVPIVLLAASLNGLLFEILLWNILGNYEFPDSTGLVSFGVIPAVMAWGCILAKATKRPAAADLDTIALILPLILAIYRIGCLLNGCCHGMEIGGALAELLLQLKEGWVARYPTQVLLMLMNFGIFSYLWLKRKRKKFQGELVISYLLLYSSGRLIVDALRDLPRVLGPLSLHQLSSLVILLITIGITLHLRNAGRLAGRKAQTPGD
jgi:phosphatidylglycerol:prolipoprotein diacylglycerol transferase